MICRHHISVSISRLAISLLLLIACSSGASAQLSLKYKRDSIPLFNGFCVAVDLGGLAQKALSSYGQYEAALRVNLHNQYFPIVEAGLGVARHNDDEVTSISYKTRAPYFRLGGDVNIMNNKHTGNRVYLGVRYGFTSYKVDISRPQLIDPVWKYYMDYDVRGERCHQHWGEILFGLEAHIFGPIHLGWSGRYRFRFAHHDGIIGKSWYVPGYGKQESSALGYSFYLSVDI